jgi:hypothetical protein
MKKSYSPIYTPAIVVVHGKSEKIISEHIKSNLRLNLHVHSRATSIQINGLVHELTTNFPSVNSLKRNPQLVLNVEKGVIQNFKIFTLMDTDDCSETTKNEYISGSLFREYALKDYVVPVFTDPDLEHVFYSCGLIPKIFNDDEKVAGYMHCFPKISPPFDEIKNKEDELRCKANALKKSKSTNFEVFIDYCITEALRRRTCT